MGKNKRIIELTQDEILVVGDVLDAVKENLQKNDEGKWQEDSGSWILSLSVEEYRALGRALKKIY